MLNVAVPELLKVTLGLVLLLCNAWVPKLIDEELRTAWGVPWAIPLRVTVCGDPAALVVMTMLAARVPMRVGVNAVEIMQLALGARLVVQVLIWLKSAGLVPPRTIPLMLKAAVPELLKVTF